MKKSIALFSLVLLAVMVCPLAAGAGTVTLQWGQSTGADGYRIYRMPVGEQPITNPPRTPIGTVGKALTYSDTTVTAGAWSYFVTAYNSWGESAPSNVVSTPPLVAAPNNLMIVVVLPAAGQAGQ